MSPARSPRTRARDLDRTEVCSALDAAYADGQLDGDEHRVRTASAMSAKTLGELHALVEDLQLQQPVSELREPPPAPPARRGRIVAAAIAVLAVVGAGFGAVQLAFSSPSSSFVRAEPVGPGPGAGVEPIVVAPVELHTPDGFRAFVDAVRNEFGTTQVSEATIYPDYAIVDTAVPGAPARKESSYYRGGFEAPSPGGSRDPDRPLVDLATIDVDAILGLLAGAGASLHVENPTSRYLIIGDDGDGPSVAVYASNADFGESGYLEAKPDGTIISVHPYEPG